MSIINTNPFRVLGISITSSEREIQKQITKATRFAEVGKSVKFETDFLFLGELRRTKESISKASSAIEQPTNKLKHSLFWFWNANHIDDAAIDNLSNENVDKAIDVWTKVVKEGDVSSKNFSCLSNLKTLYLGLSLQNDSLNKELFTKGVSLAGKFMNHEQLNSYIKKVTGDHFKIKAEELEVDYISTIYNFAKPYLDKENGISTIEFLSSFETFSKKAVNFISSKFSGDPVKKIQDQISTTSELREKNPIEAISFGEILHKNTLPQLKSLSEILGNSDVNFQMVSEKLANEILQCGIDFFNQVREDRTAIDEDGNKALTLCKYAKKISCGQSSIRINETIQFIEDWLKDAPNKKQAKGHEALNQLYQLINDAVEQLQ
jgi:hypothetical protein